jgi:hypothetical protein
MLGADEELVRSLAEEVRTARGLAQRDRRATMQLLYIVSAVILGKKPAKRILQVKSIIQDPDVQDLVHEWEAEEYAEDRAEQARRFLHKVLAARSFSVTAHLRKRIDYEPDLARLESWFEAAVTARSIDDVFRGR